MRRENKRWSRHAKLRRDTAETNESIRKQSIYFTQEEEEEEEEETQHEEEDGAGENLFVILKLRKECGTTEKSSVPDR